MLVSKPREGTTLFGEKLDVRSVRNSLLRIKKDVARCLKWLDLGLSPTGSYA